MSGAKLGKRLIASGTRVPAGFYWQHVQGHGITVDLIDAQVGTLNDPPGSWHAVKELHLSSFRYDRIESDMDVRERLSWLAKHDATVSRFTSWPSLQLANVLRRLGFAREAARILIQREEKQRAAECNAAVTDIAGILRRGWAGCKCVFLHFLSWVFKWMFGYGHQPAWVLFWIVIIWLVTFWFAEQTHRRGQFAPTSAVVLNSPEWLRSFPCTPLPTYSLLWRAQLDAWVKTEPQRDYESFSAWLYALDLFIPLDSLGQEKNWAPSASRGTWGEWGHRLRWLVQMAGWLITAMGAAVITGLIGRRD
jgi:cbb3-type cytochrome oxidase subunit 3